MLKLLIIIIALFGLSAPTCTAWQMCGKPELCNCYMDIVACIGRNVDIIPDFYPRSLTATLFIIRDTSVETFTGIEFKEWPSLKRLTIEDNINRNCAEEKVILTRQCMEHNITLDMNCAFQKLSTFMFETTVITTDPSANNSSLLPAPERSMHGHLITILIALCILCTFLLLTVIIIILFKLRNRKTSPVSAGNHIFLNDIYRNTVDSTI